LRILIVAFVLLSQAGCGDSKTVQEQTSSAAPASDQTVSFVQDVKPILDGKCIACHACYDAPCQLKLTSGAGLARGATQKKVYDNKRVLSAPPTRLFVDAQTTAQWREKGFFPVVNEQPGDSRSNLEHSLISKMVILGREHPLPPRSPVPDHIELGLQRDDICTTLPDFDRYARKNPLGGMPLAITGLSDTEYETLQAWIGQGGPIDEMPLKPTEKEQRQIGNWEQFLNQPTLKEKLTARYLYEHFFLAHLYFDNVDEPAFFRLVRSASPPGKPIEIIPTTRPNDDPGQTFYYRLQQHRGTVVHKTHTVYALNDARLQRFDELFLKTAWDVKTLPDYSDDNAANPFLTFSAIPARSRYQFLLDDAQYFVRTFIRGPVCRGQIATNVIEDQFYVLFQDPAHDLSITDSDYLRSVESYLEVARESLDLLDFGEDLLVDRLKRNEYIRLRGRAYREYQPDGPDIQNIWDGDGDNADAMLTVFRHFDNATVVQGFIGAFPKTLWVMDYPLLERTYYALVVNFNEFGGVGHQAAVRLYFDLIRTGAENNFLHYMPPGVRTEIRRSWYQGPAAELKSALAYAVENEDMPSDIDYKTDQPKAEFLAIVTKHLAAVANQDPLNRCAKPPCYRAGLGDAGRVADATLESLASRPASRKGMQFIHYLPDVTFLRVSTGTMERDMAYTLVRNKAHSNVAFMFNESNRRERNNDTLTVYPGLLGSYPNFILVVPQSELDEFAAALHAVGSATEFRDILEHYGIERTHPDIWAHFHWFIDYMKREHPVQAGVYDLNRYKKVADLISD